MRLRITFRIERERKEQEADARALASITERLAEDSGWDDPLVQDLASLASAWGAWRG